MAIAPDETTILVSITDRLRKLEEWRSGITYKLDLIEKVDSRLHHLERIIYLAAGVIVAAQFAVPFLLKGH